jgi:hypothetical protein
MDPIACVERGSVDCKYAGRLVAGMLDDKVHRVDYMDVVDFFNYSGCLGPTDNVGSIMLSYDQWTMTANKDDIQLLTEGIISVSGCKIDFCRNLEFSGNSDFAGIGVDPASSSAFTDYILTSILGISFFLHPNLRRHVVRLVLPVPPLRRRVL